MLPSLEVRRYQRTVESHSHDFHQVVIALEGALRMNIAGVDGEVASDTVALISAGQQHSFGGTGENSFLIVDIPEDAGAATDTSGRLLWQYALTTPFVRVDPAQQPLVRYLADAAHSGRLGGPLVAPAAALLLGTIARQLGLQERGALPSGLQAVATYVDSHLEWPLDVADLAHIAHVSVSRLHALFRAHMQVTPKTFVASRRLERATALLRETNLPVAEVAARVGYQDQAAFTRFFRKHTGVTPSAWRAVEAAQKTGA